MQLEAEQREKQDLEQKSHQFHLRCNQLEDTIRQKDARFEELQTQTGRMMRDLKEEVRTKCSSLEAEVVGLQRKITVQRENVEKENLQQIEARRIKDSRFTEAASKFVSELKREVQEKCAELTWEVERL